MRLKLVLTTIRPDKALDKCTCALETHPRLQRSSDDNSKMSLTQGSAIAQPVGRAEIKASFWVLDSVHRRGHRLSGPPRRRCSTHTASWLSYNYVNKYLYIYIYIFTCTIPALVIQFLVGKVVDWPKRSDH